jgi:hypothetical protein
VKEKKRLNHLQKIDSKTGSSLSPLVGLAANSDFEIFRSSQAVFKQEQQVSRQSTRGLKLKSTSTSTFPRQCGHGVHASARPSCGHAAA